MTSPTRSAPWRVVAATLFVVAWGGNEFTPLLVMYRLQHHLPPTTVYLLLFAYVVGIVPALLIGGPLSDRLGRTRLLRPAPWIAAAGSLVIGLSPTVVPLLVLGRVLSGVALGLGMAVGGAWIKELSAPPHDPAAAPGAGARRQAMSLTAGFAIGAGVAGVLAQWGPLPDLLPFAVNIVLAVGAGVLVRRAPETVTDPSRGRLRDDLRIPAAAHRRFLFVVLPVAPWVFGCAACAYAVLPALMASHVSSAPIAFSALVCVSSLGVGFLVQSWGRRLDRPGTARAVVVALTVVAIGMALAAVAARWLTVPTTLLAGLVLGVGYGLSMIGGLTEIQRIAGPRDLAGLTAVYYSVTYVGFAVPAVMSAVLAQVPGLGYSGLFLTGTVVATLCLAVVLSRSRSHLEPQPDRPT